MAEQLHVFEYNDGMDYMIGADGADADGAFREWYSDALDDNEMREQLGSRNELPDEHPMKVWWHEGRGKVSDSSDGGAVTERTGNGLRLLGAAGSAQRSGNRASSSGYRDRAVTASTRTSSDIFSR